MRILGRFVTGANVGPVFCEPSYKIRRHLARRQHQGLAVALAPTPDCVVPRRHRHVGMAELGADNPSETPQVRSQLA